LEKVRIREPQTHGKLPISTVGKNREKIPHGKKFIIEKPYPHPIIK
jgi:hypothetical protein